MRFSAQMALYTSQHYLPGRVDSLVNSKSVFGPVLLDLQMAPAVLSHLVISVLILIHTGPLMHDAGFYHNNELSEAGSGSGSWP